MQNAKRSYDEDEEHLSRHATMHKLESIQPHAPKRINALLALLRKEALLELRQQYSFYGLLLYLVSTLFVLYMAIEAPDAAVWNGLFWILQLFVCINAVAKTFLAEGAARMKYYNALMSPTIFVGAKILYNAVFMALLSSTGLLLFGALLGWPIIHGWAFFGVSLLGSVSLSGVFSFLAAIAAKASGNSVIMAILGFPIVVPMLLILVRLSMSAFSESGSVDTTALLALLGTDVLLVVLSLILYPFLWRD